MTNLTFGAIMAADSNRFFTVNRERRSAMEPIIVKDATIKGVVDQPSQRPSVTTSMGEEVSAPTTTAEQDRGTKGQRDVNLLWEHTQRMIALSTIFVTLSVASWLAVAGEADNRTAASVFLYGVANLVIGFYFGRTNHTRVGGVNQR